MAANNSNAVQPFIIALIVFVMLTFVLAVTTYLFFKKAHEAEAKTEAAQVERNTEREVKLAYRDSRAELVKSVLGFPEDDPEVLKSKDAVEKLNEQIKAKKQDAIDDVYGKYLAQEKLQPTYADAVTWLSSSIDKHYGQMKDLQAEKDRFAAEKKQLAERHVDELKKKEDSNTAAKAALDKLTSEQKDYESATAVRVKKLDDEMRAANDRAKKLEDLGLEIESLATATYKGSDGVDVPVLSGNRKTEFAARDAKGRVELLKQELAVQGRMVRRLNQIIAQLRVADPSLQSTVLAATPKDDRIDGFDGRILSVNELDRTVLVACGRTTGLRTGLQFYVYNPTDPQPQLGSKKAVVEVVAIESDSLVRCRVRQDSVRAPIIPGDVVATSLWAPGTPLELVVVGLVQLGGEPDADLGRLRQLIERIGGTVSDTVSPSTTMVVDAGVPQVKGIDAEGQVASRKQWTAKQKQRRAEQMDLAKQQGIKVIAIEPFLDMLGLQMDSVRANRLPVPVDPQAAPTRSENVAF
jgi:cytoskeletal protein RodZ